MRSTHCFFFLFFLFFSFGESTTKPNIIFILTDDQDLLLKSMDYMPLVKKYITEQGATFPNYFITNPVCCPSRASILRGQYAHNTQIIDLADPGGGGKRFHELGLENSTIATWLKEVGYRTAFHGKYLNQYPCNITWVPKGWDDWFALCTPKIYQYVDSNYNDNGVIKNVKEYQSDTIGQRTIKFIEETYARNEPFFIHLSFVAPHAPARPAKKYKKLFKDVKLPRAESYNQKDVSFMPSYIRTLPYTNATQLANQEEHYRKRLRSLQSVDEWVEQIILKLEARKILKNTYIIYSSDNGFHMGQHRLIQGKRSPYEEDIRVPFIIRGPGIPANISVSSNTMNIDIAPTFAEIAGAKIPSFVDGKSILPLIHRPRKQTDKEYEKSINNFRPFVLIEHWGIAPGGYLNNTWQGLRIHNSTDNIVYTSWCTFNHEFYNISTDPYQISNRYGYDFDKMHEYDSIMRQLFYCRGSECNEISHGIPLAEFIATPLTPCFNGKLSPLPTFHTGNIRPIDYTKEELILENIKESENEIKESILDFSYFSMFMIVLFVIFSIYIFFIYRKKFSLPVYNNPSTAPGEELEEINREHHEEGKQVRKRAVV